MILRRITASRSAAALPRPRRFREALAKWRRAIREVYLTGISAGQRRDYIRPRWRLAS